MLKENAVSSMGILNEERKGMDTKEVWMYGVLTASRDEKMVKDYMERLVAEGGIQAFVEENKLCEEDARDELLQLMSCETVKELKDYLGVLHQLDGYCKGLFPKGFICDAVVLAAMKELRIMMPKLEVDYCPPDTVLTLENTSIKRILSWLEQQLKVYMDKDYNLDRVVTVMIEYCGMDGTERELETYEIPQDCDRYVLEEVAVYARDVQNRASIPISKEVKEEAYVYWKLTHDKEHWQLEFRRAVVAIDRLIEWLDAHEAFRGINKKVD